MTSTVTSSVFDLDGFDRSVRPQDDLYRHVNGAWLSRTGIPDDKPSVGAFIELRDQAEAAVRELITRARAGDPEAVESKIANLYASFMDEERIEALGASPLAPDLAEVDAVADVPGLVRHLGRMIRRGAGGLVGVDVDADPGDPERQLVFVGQSGLGLPDEEYYRDDQHAAIRGKYLEHVRTMLSLAGVEDAEEQARAVVDLETRIAAHHWDKVTVRDLTKMYNPMGFEELAASTAVLDWRLLAEGAELPGTALRTVVNAQPSFFTGVEELLVDELLPAWRSWARWHLVSARASYLSSAFVEEDFAFYGTVLSGTPRLKDRWKRGVELVNGVLGEAVGELYVAAHFSPTAKERMDELVANLLEAYRVSITGLDWMTEETRQEALKKLSQFTPKIGYPEQWKDYSSLRIDPEDLVGNRIRTTEFRLAELVRKAGHPVEKHEWLMTPQTVNAYYHPLRNEIVFPAAILQPPFFSETADDAVNYGGIGAVIGHEIGHGFDDQGSQFDGDGRLENWWTEADRAAFEERTSALIAQYDALVPEGLTDHVNGALTIGENIGDLGGLTIAWKAYVLSLEGAEPPVIDGETGAQRFFRSWASVWREKRREAEAKRLLTIDPHSPPEFRCNQIVHNLDEFAAAFDLTETDALWLDPTKRVTIW